MWGGKYAYHEADVEHRHEGTHTDHLPTPATEIDEHEYRADEDQRGIGTDFHLTEILFQEFRYGQRQPFTGQHERVATHLTSDTEGQYGSTNEQFDESQRVTDKWIEVERNLQETGHPHGQVGIEPEKEGDQNLGVLPGLEILAQEQQL